MESVYSSENKPKYKSMKTSVLFEENRRFFAKLTDSGVLLDVVKLSDNEPCAERCDSIVVSTPLATAVPEQLFDYANRRAFLEAAGIYPSAEHEVFVSLAVDGVVTVMAVNGECAEWLRELKVSRYHLLQMNLLRARAKQFRSGRVLMLNISAESLAVTLHIDGKLSIAEIFPVANHDEILFIVKSLEQQWLADGGQIRIWGVGSEQCYEYLSQFVVNIALDRLDNVNTSEYNNLIICNI